MKKKEIYSLEELELFEKLEKDVEQGNYKPIPQKELKEKKAFFKQVALNTIEKRKKKKSYNIRLFENDVENIKALALKEGLSYQTFLSSMVHKIATGQIKAL